MLTILAVAWEIAPSIFSPRIKVPLTSVKVIVGAAASVLESIPSKTAMSRNASALPRDIPLSEGRVPNASVAPATTFNCFINFVVFVFCTTDVFNRVAIIFNLAPVPKTPLLVIVRVVEPAPENPVEALTISPCFPDPVPPVRMDIV